MPRLLVVALLLPLLVTGCEQAKKAQKEAERAARKFEEGAREAEKVVKDAKKAVTAAFDLAQKIAALNPVDIETNPTVAVARVQQHLGIKPPQGYVGGISLSLDGFGERDVEVATLIPKGASSVRIFAPGKEGLRFDPGRHTVVFVGKLPISDPTLLRQAALELARQNGPPVDVALGTVKAGSDLLATYDVKEAGEARKKLRSRTFVLEDGRVVHVVGPAQGFDDKVVGRLGAALAKAHAQDPLLRKLPPL